jgi:hypothetical protein
VEETAIEQLKPTPEKIPEFVHELLSILKEKTLSMDYIAPSNEEKLAHGNKLVKMIYDWCREQGPLYTKQLEDLVTIATDHQSIQKCPVNLRLAEYIENSNIKESVGLKFTHERERRASKSVILNIFNDYEYHKVLSGITEVQGQYDTSVVLTIRTKNPLRPVCAMVIAIIPSSFGLYLLSFTYSTRLDHTQREYWDSTTFLMKKLHAISFKDAEGTETLKEVEDLYSQFISFFVQSCLAREIHLQRIGALGQPLI